MRTLVACCLLAGLAGPFAASAGDARPPADIEALEKDRAAKAQRFNMGRRISRYLQAAQEEVDADRVQEAEALLLRLDLRLLNPLERASVFRFLAHVAYEAGELDKAISYFRKVLNEQILKVHDETRIRFNVAQLAAQREDWKGVVEWVADYVHFSQEPAPLAFYLEALAHYQLGDADAAIQSVQTAIEVAGEPKEAWLRLLSGIHAEREDYRNAAPVLEELLVRFPKKQYWVQLSLIYGALEDYPRSLAVQQIAYAQGYITEDRELRRLAQSYLFRELPYPAASVLEKGIEEGAIEGTSSVYQLLANSWIAAREYERALGPLRKAAELAEDGELYVRLAQVLMQREQWRSAAEMLEKAVEKGGLESPARAALLRGVAWYNGENVPLARDFFLRAREFEETRAQAESWLGHIERETAESNG